MTPYDWALVAGALLGGVALGVTAILMRIAIAGIIPFARGPRGARPFR